jgi:uncharacterized lipoprotein YddW (UPF0748 family)
MAILVLLAALSVPAAAAPEYRAFWVNANTDAFKTPESVDRMVEDLSLARCNAIFMQVRSRSTSFYRNSLEPFSEDPAVPSGFDPLAYLIDRAHRSGIEVHAWVPVTPFWNREQPPKDPRHPWFLHGPQAIGDDMWMTVSNLGKTIDYVDPGNAGVMRYLADVIVDIPRHYNIDGIHLDYIRYPAGTGAAFDYGWNPGAVARFNRLNGSTGQPARDDARFADFRRKQVTDLVRQIYLRTLAIRPSIKVSAALITWNFRGPATRQDFSKTDGYIYCFQDWPKWLEEGIVDLGIPMSYFDETQHRAALDSWMEFEKDHQYGRGILVGLGIYMNPIADTREQIRRALAPSNAGNRLLGVDLFSYNFTNGGSAPVPNREFFQAAADWFANVVAVPELPWKTRPRTGHLYGWLQFREGPKWANDTATIYLQRASTKEVRAIVTDATGFFGAVDLPPDSYRLGLKSGTWLTKFRRVDPGMAVLINLLQTKGLSRNNLFTRCQPLPHGRGSESGTEPRP